MPRPPLEPERPPIFVPTRPGEPLATWSAARACPRCGSAAITLDPIHYRFLLLSALAPATCGECGLHFSTKSGRSVTPYIVSAYLAPLVLLAVIVGLVSLLR
jgi:hypothetical protein